MLHWTVQVAAFEQVYGAMMDAARGNESGNSNIQMVVVAICC